MGKDKFIIATWKVHKDGRKEHHKSITVQAKKKELNEWLKDTEEQLSDC